MDRAILGEDVFALGIRRFREAEFPIEGFHHVQDSSEKIFFVTFFIVVAHFGFVL